MTRLVWDKPKDRYVKYGVEKGVIYPKNSPGVVWNGLIDISESDAESDVAVGYFDGQAYYRERSSEGFSAKITAYTFPDTLYSDSTFGMTYVTDEELHLVYNAMISSTDRPMHSERNDPDPTIFSWELVTTPVQIPGLKACSHLIVDISAVPAETLESLQHLLYGTDSTDPRLPPIPELFDIFEVGAIFKVIDNGDGTWTAIGPDSWFAFPTPDTFEITSPSAIFIDDSTYKISSW